VTVNDGEYVVKEDQGWMMGEEMMKLSLRMKTQLDDSEFSQRRRREWGLGGFMGFGIGIETQFLCYYKFS